MQTAPKPKPGEVVQFKGTFDCFRQTVTKEVSIVVQVDDLCVFVQGFFALYKGMAAPLVGVSPLFAVYFAGCSVGRWLQQSHPGEEMTY